MRPLPGGDAYSPSSAAKPRSRKSSVDYPAAPTSNVPTTFIMKRVEDLESMTTTQSTGKQRENTFGVQSLADTLEAAFGSENATAGSSSSPSLEPSSLTTNHKELKLRSESHSSSTGSSKAPESTAASPKRKVKKKPSRHAAPSAYTQSISNAPSPMPTSTVSSPPRSISMQSLKLSDEESVLDEVASQAIASSSEEDEDAETQQAASSSFPQLVMPSIQMPTRRPFTIKGKSMGKLKVLVAGETGIGKSSLIRSIVQLCEDIVHVDPLSPSQSFSQPPPPKSKSRKRKAGAADTTGVTEIHASTKPYPHWWTDVEDSRILRRRKSSLDTVLERNICFVDTPGYSPGASSKEDMNLVMDYVESLLHQTSSVTTLEDNDVLGVVSGNGGVMVDVVLYLLPPNRDITDDIEFMQRLSSLTNVIPVIAKSDTLLAQDAVALKTSILARLQTTSVRPFLFGKALEDALLAVQSLPITMSSTFSPEAQTEESSYPFSTPTYPFAISSTIGSDNDIMDASLLMSPDYVQPLLPSELPALITQVFDPDSISWLRHSAAKKFLVWRRRTELPGNSYILQGLQQAQSSTTASVGLEGTNRHTSTTSSIFSAASPSGVLVPRSGSPFYASNLQSPFLATSASLANSEMLENPGAFSLARYTSATQGELPLSEVRIAKWATDLQRSLRNERDRYEELQRDDRAKWLLERVGEEVSRGTIMASPSGSPRAEWAVIRHDDEKQKGTSGQRFYKAAGLDSRDPLGLCNFGDEFYRRGTVLVKILGGMSVLGAVIVTMARALGMETSLTQTGWSWWNWMAGTE